MYCQNSCKARWHWFCEMKVRNIILLRHIPSFSVLMMVVGNTVQRVCPKFPVGDHEGHVTRFSFVMRIEILCWVLIGSAAKAPEENGVHFIKELNKAVRASTFNEKSSGCRQTGFLFPFTEQSLRGNFSRHRERKKDVCLEKPTQWWTSLMRLVCSRTVVYSCPNVKTLLLRIHLRAGKRAVERLHFPVHVHIRVDDNILALYELRNIKRPVVHDRRFPWWSKNPFPGGQQLP